MSKISRNDPCHCGSGKKYKKCCESSDKEKEKHQFDEHKIDINDTLEEGMSHFGNDFPDILKNLKGSVNFDNNDNIAEYTEEQELTNTKKQGYSNNYPSINEEEQEKVASWWEKYRNIEPNEVIAHLNSFLAKNEINTIINLSLEYEVLFEIISYYTNEGKVDEVIPFMMEFKQKYPEAYIRSAPYYDSDIIAWLVSKNRKEEVPKYLDYFEKYPFAGIDKYFEVLSLLLATNNSDLVMPTVQKNYKSISNSPNLNSNGEILNFIIPDIYFSYIGMHDNTQKMEELVEKIKSLGLDLTDVAYTVHYWKDMLAPLNEDYRIWNEKLFAIKLTFNKELSNILNNFNRFLNQEIKIAPASCEFYKETMSSFLSELNEKLNTKQSLLDFPEELTKSVINEKFNFFGPAKAKQRVRINALYYFAAYLHKCGNYSVEKRDKVQNMALSIYNDTYDKYPRVEMLALNKFPIFG